MGIMLLMPVVARFSAVPVQDPDAWWHLHVGSLLWDRSITLTQTRPLSTFATEPWLPRDWMAQLAASKAEDWFGLPGVAWLHGAAFMTLVCFIYFVSRLRGSQIPALIATFGCVLGAFESLTQRPQMASFVFLFVILGAWLRTADDLKPRWWTIPVMWVWANTHGMWYFGVAIGLAVSAGLLLDHRATRRDAVRLCTALGLGIAVATLTPAGPRTLLSAFETSGKWAFVSEWSPTNFISPSPFIAATMVLIVVLTAARADSRTSWVTIALLILGSGLILMSARTVAPGVMVIAPLVAEAFQKSMSEDGSARVSWSERFAVITAVAVSLVWLGVLVPNSSAQPAAVPDGLNAELDRLPPETVILNEYGLGGWLHWRHPDLNTVIDGFTDGYTVAAIESYVQATRVEPGWQGYVRDTGAPVALLKDESPLAHALTAHLNWTEIATDAGYTLLARPRQGR
jgi:hypothetical protein